MKELMKRLRADFLLSSLLAIALGAVFILWPELISGLIGTICAVVLIIIGVIYLCGYFFRLEKNPLSAAMGAVVTFLGIWVLIQPEIVLTLIPIIIGVLLATHGIRGLRESLAAKKYGYTSWGLGAAFAVVSIVLGIVSIVHAFGFVKFAFWGIGAALIYNGLSNIYIAVVSSKYERRYRKNNEAIDVTFVEDGDEESAENRQ